jgi:hypothetical protein
MTPPTPTTFSGLRGDWPPAGTISGRQLRAILRSEGIASRGCDYLAAFAAAGLSKPEQRYGRKAYTPAHVEAVRRWWESTRDQRGAIQ